MATPLLASPAADAPAADAPAAEATDALPIVDLLAYGRVDIDSLGHVALARLQADPRLHWWVELDDQLLVMARHTALEALSSATRIEILPMDVRPADLYILRRGHQDQQQSSQFEVLARGGRFAVIQSRGGVPEIQSFHEDHDLMPADGLAHGGSAAAAHEREKSLHAMVLPFAPNVVLARQLANRPQALGAKAGQQLAARYGVEVASLAQTLVDEVDPSRWLAAVEVLAGFNRYTHSPELLQARDWLVQQFDALPGLEVTTQAFQVGGTTAYNVISQLTGSARPDEWHFIGAHYDSISQNTNNSAPGAEDNASGCAGVLEMARIFAAHPPEETVFFLCYSGEELGLLGSEFHASGVVSAGDADKVETMLNMDMIGYTGDADLDCLLETDSDFASLLTPFADAAEAYTNLRIVTTLFAFGSDHVPYLNRDIPALLTIENDWDQYPGYHRTGDVPGNLDLDMGGDTLRMNVGAMALRIGSSGESGGSVVFSDGFESSDLSRWGDVKP